ncbi:MAG: ATP-binding protein [Bacteroidota bacterium]
MKKLLKLTLWAILALSITSPLVEAMGDRYDDDHLRNLGIDPKIQDLCNISPGLRYSPEVLLTHPIVLQSNAAKFTLRALKLQIGKDGKISGLDALRFIQEKLSKEDIDRYKKRVKEGEELDHKLAMERKNLKIKEVAYKHDKKVGDDEAQRIKMIEGAKIKAHWEGIKQLFTKKYLMPTARFLGAVFSFFFLAKYLIPFLVKKIFDKPPKIVSETNIPRGLFKKHVPEKSKLPKAIYPGDLQERMDIIIQEDKRRIEKNRKKQKFIYGFEHILLYGEPGVGKTLFVSLLIQEAGFLFLKIKGSTFSQMSDRSEALRAIYEVIEYAEKKAEKHKNTVLIFFDEAEVIFPKRALEKTSELDRKIIAALLGNFEKSTKRRIKLVLSTNHPELLDKAVKDRCSEKIFIPSPDLKSRIALLNMYLKMPPDKNIRVSVELNENERRKLAERAEGLNGRDLDSIITKIKERASLYGKKPSYEDFEKEIDRKREDKEKLKKSEGQ